MIGFWATLSLNIPDFTRYARSQRDQVLGQALGLPTTMALYSFIGVAVTSATIEIYGEAIWDPVDLLSRFRNPLVLSVAMVSLCLATLATNIAANVVSPANDFAHLWPRRISFRTGGLITGVLGILMQPWKLIADPSGYIFNWLVAYSALLGAVGGILIADYYVIRRTRLDLRRALPGRRSVLVRRRLQPRGDDRAGRRDRPVRARVPGHHRRDGGRAGLDVDVSLRLVHQLRALGGELSHPDEVWRGRSRRNDRRRVDQPLPVFQTGSWCESPGDSNQRVMVIFCWV